MSRKRKMGKYRKACGGGTAKLRDLNLHNVDMQSVAKPSCEEQVGGEGLRRGVQSRTGAGAGGWRRGQCQGEWEN